MDMTTFWSTVTNKLTIGQLKADYPAAFAALEDEDMDLADAEFAFTVIPNIGPGGATSDADEADLADRDPDEEIQDADGPSLCGDKALMVYFSEVDELRLYHEAFGERETDGWLLWNY